MATSEVNSGQSWREAIFFCRISPGSKITLGIFVFDATGSDTEHVAASPIQLPHSMVFLVNLFRNALCRGLFLVLLISSDAFAQEPASITDEVKESIHQRVDRGRNVGIVIGLVGPNSVEYYGYGTTSVDREEVPDENSVFEIGSISKVFTTILLADMVIGGDAQLDDPIQKYLPESVRIPSREGQEITLMHIATHMSALPRLPSNMAPADVANPYADYNVEQMYAFLSGHELRRDIGSKYEYSNLAMGLLGHALALHDGTDYEILLASRVLDVLGMQNTGITLTPDMQDNLAIGHDQGGKVKNWDIPTLAGAGAIRSTVRDMLRFLAANMDLKNAPADLLVKDNALLEAMRLSHELVVNRATGGTSMALGWHIRHSGENESIWHNGGTGGYRSFAGFNRGGQYGVVVLTNSTASVDDIGFHMLDSSYALINVLPSAAAVLRSAIDEDGIGAAASKFAEMKETGPPVYDMSAPAILNLGILYEEKGNIAAAAVVFEIYTEAHPDQGAGHERLAGIYSEMGRTSEAIASYQKSLTSNPGNENVKQKLKELGVDESTFEPAIVVDLDVLESYVGDYSLAPQFVMTISLDGTQLMAQATGQANFPIFPSTENRFYWKVVDAQVTFNRDENGKVVSLTMHQAGQNVPGVRRN